MTNLPTTLHLKIRSRDVLLLAMWLVGSCHDADKHPSSPGTADSTDRGSSGPLLLNSGAAAGSLPLMNADPAVICSGAQFIDATGEVRTGVRICGSGNVPDCIQDGPENCKSNKPHFKKPLPSQI